jgi:hypothetical protein
MAVDPKLTEQVRLRGHRGGVIAMHRAFHSYRLGTMNMLVAFFLFLFFMAIWALLLPSLCRFWADILAWGVRSLPLHAQLAISTQFVGRLRLEIPLLRMDPVLPGFAMWSGTCAVTLILLGATFVFDKGLIPIAYFLRLVLGVQCTSLVYFLLWPSRFPHSPDSYMETLLDSGIGIITAIPLLFGLTYYIFDFGLLRKALLTALTMAYLSAFLPLQLLLQAMVLQKSVLFMPPLYIIFGMPLDVLIIISFYSWGMSWSFRVAR